MTAPANVAPIIIKRKKKVSGDGHHGGAWKVAYADFVTAMMAFFMLMWLLNATTETQRKGIADYFNPTIPIARISGGGNGLFGGDDVAAEERLAEASRTTANTDAAAGSDAEGDTGTREDEVADGESSFSAEAKKVEEALMAMSGESMVSDELMRHIVTRVTDEGLIVEFFDTDDQQLFEEGTAIPRPITSELAHVVAEVFALTRNQVAVNGHMRPMPAVLRSNPVWSLSTERAMQVRLLIEAAGLEPKRMARVTGFGDRKNAAENPLAIRNNRIEVILLRDATK
ncbi:MAG: flagellar motor protein MotB [Paracoccaceae bacterium]